MLEMVQSRKREDMKVEDKLDPKEHARIKHLMANYLKYCIEKGELKSTVSPVDGDMVIYFNEEGYPLHSGLVCSDGEVESLWQTPEGKTIGVFKHDVEKVPSIYYGVGFKYYSKHIEPKKSLPNAEN